MRDPARHPPGESAVREELNRLLNGPLASSQKLARFLEFVVTETMAGRGDQLKEYTVAVRGLGRPPAFDPANDAGVRVAARQLRFKLNEYYGQDVIPGDVSIILPKGGYVPDFVHRSGVNASQSVSAAGERVGPPVPSGESSGSVVAPPVWSVLRIRRAVGLTLLAIAVLLSAWALRPGHDGTVVPVIAVLPFVNLTGSDADIVLSDGLSDEITSVLARDTAARVIARTSAWKFRSRPTDIRDVGRQLGATHVVEGSIRRVGSRYRISIQVNAASDGIRVWAQQYEVDRGSAFGMFDVIAQNVHNAVVQHAGARPRGLPPRRAPVDPRVAELLMEGRYFWNQRSDSGYQRAIEVLRRATQADPTYAPGWAALAVVYATMEVNHATPGGQSARAAMAAAERALSIDSLLGEAWTVIGMMRAFNEWRWAAADSAFQKAVTLSPNNATAHSWYSNVLTALDEPDAAVAQMEVARQLDPLSAAIAYGVAQAWYYGRRWQEGLAAIDRAIALNPDSPWPRLLKGKLLKGAGRRDEAQAVFSGLPDSFELALLDESHRTREIPRLIAKIPVEEKGRAQFWIATNYAQIGWKDSAFAWLDRAYAMRQADLSSILVDPMIEPLKSDPRYHALVQRMGLETSYGGSLRHAQYGRSR